MASLWLRDKLSSSAEEWTHREKENRNHEELCGEGELGGGLFAEIALKLQNSEKELKRKGKG